MQSIPSQVPQPTCFWKWHSWQLGNLTTLYLVCLRPHKLAVVADGRVEHKRLDIISAEQPHLFIIICSIGIKLLPTSSYQSVTAFFQLVGGRRRLWNAAELLHISILEEKILQNWNILCSLQTEFFLLRGRMEEFFSFLMGESFFAHKVGLLGENWNNKRSLPLSFPVKQDCTCL